MEWSPSKTKRYETVPIAALTAGYDSKKVIPVRFIQLIKSICHLNNLSCSSNKLIKYSPNRCLNTTLFYHLENFIKTSYKFTLRYNNPNKIDSFVAVSTTPVPRNRPKFILYRTNNVMVD